MMKVMVQMPFVETSSRRQTRRNGREILKKENIAGTTKKWKCTAIATSCRVACTREERIAVITGRSDRESPRLFLSSSTMWPFPCIFRRSVALAKVTQGVYAFQATEFNSVSRTDVGENHQPSNIMVACKCSRLFHVPASSTPFSRSSSS